MKNMNMEKLHFRLPFSMVRIILFSLFPLNSNGFFEFLTDAEDVAKILLENGADVNMTCCNSGVMAIHMAVSKRIVRMVFSVHVLCIF